jgi:hypothetical protein
MPQQISFADAVTIANTGNNTTSAGQVISTTSVAIAKLPTAQKNAVVALVQSMVDAGTWPGKAAHVVSVEISRHPTDVVALSCVVYGLIVHPDASTAAANLNVTGKPAQQILGVVP